DANATPGNAAASSVSTQYITSIDSSARVLTLTTTTVYYTRDSPLTITSLLTTTIPPRTIVSTIVGTKTIVGTNVECTQHLQSQSAFEPVTDLSTTVTTTTLIFNSITTT